MRIVEPLDFIPQRFHLLQTVSADLFQGRQTVDQFTVFKYRHLQLPGREIVDHFGLPGGIGVKNLHILCIIHRLIVDTQVVGNGLAGVVADEAVQLLIMGIGDLGHVLGDLDLGCYAC